MNMQVDVKPRKFSGLKKLAIFGVISGVIAGACSYSPTQVLTAISSERGVKISRDISYGADSRQVLDIYQPDKADGKSSTAGGLPVVIFIHGGSWQTGEKEGYGFVGRSLAQAGYVVEFLPTKDIKDTKSPDILMDGEKWELKTPKTDKLSAIERNLKRATKQSGNVVIDSHRLRKIHDSSVQEFLVRKFSQQKTIKKLLFVNRKHQVIDISNLI